MQHEQIINKRYPRYPANLGRLYQYLDTLVYGQLDSALQHLLRLFLEPLITDCKRAIRLLMGWQGLIPSHYAH